jgi:hypothetical protein
LTWGHADKKAEQFPKGQAVSVSYDPDHPELWCLEPGGLEWEDCFMLLVCAGGLVLGIKEIRNFARWLQRTRESLF